MALTVHDMKGRKIGICVSGGLDSKTISCRLREAGADVLCFTANLGQPDEKDINDVAKKMAPCGVETVIVDIRKPMAEACYQVIKAEATYDGGYWNSTGIGRAVTTRELVSYLFTATKSGSTYTPSGTGNATNYPTLKYGSTTIQTWNKTYLPSFTDSDLVSGSVSFNLKIEGADYSQMRSNVEYVATIIIGITTVN